jgi:GTP-binding protein
MKIVSSEFEESAPGLASCPKRPLPEIALIGRSNVGKSSLVNMITQRRELAKVSDLPGKTKLINFFIINRNWRLVDLPGYGFAKVQLERRLQFNEAVADFIEHREFLRLVFVLIDSRLPPQPIDLEFLRWLEGAQIPYALIFTKTDKQSLSKTKLNVEVFMKAVATWRRTPPDFLLSSAEKKTGREEILQYIAAKLAQAKASAQA